jgi:hypothetical protein
VFYIDASSAATISADLKNIAAIKKAGETEDDALAWLAGQDERWLIVFNNADNTSLDLKRYFPACSHGDILITTRNHQLINLAHAADAHCKVSGMLPEDAKELLLKTSGVAKNIATEECSTVLVKVRTFSQRRRR